MRCVFFGRIEEARESRNNNVFGDHTVEIGAAVALMVELIQSSPSSRWANGLQGALQLISGLASLKSWMLKQTRMLLL